MEWVTLFALAVNEENAAGGRVVTAPTNGAAGIIPAVLKYYVDFVPGASDDGVVRFPAGRDRPSGPCSRKMRPSRARRWDARARSAPPAPWRPVRWPRCSEAPRSRWRTPRRSALSTIWGSPAIPWGGLVQIPCIERNAVGAMKAITAARMAVRGDGQHHVSLDIAIKTMRDTGADMMDKYKETGAGWTRANVVEC
jgi:L-serine dehydratase